jgi:hypothetical protein
LLAFLAGWFGLLAGWCCWLAGFSGCLGRVYASYRWLVGPVGKLDLFVGCLSVFGGCRAVLAIWKVGLALVAKCRGFLAGCIAVLLAGWTAGYAYILGVLVALLGLRCCLCA